jgi:hypothetical protein
MKGVVFTSFLEMVETKFSADMVDHILLDAAPPNGGAYTAVGTYPHEEMVALVVSLSRHCGIAVADLLKVFGEYLFAHFTRAYPSFFAAQSDAFSFLAGIEAVIHSEVRKLYPDAELPRFEIQRSTEDTLVLAYSSNKHLEDLCEGLIRACCAHFKERISLSRQANGEGDSRVERFTLTRDL